ncbi:MAG: sensor domain-containing diguanylate cyclase [Oscillospiraceae bacterium]|nr:sensor domain-containing diguanylate cyclase [Oscillospiraceae bacterium]
MENQKREPQTFANLALALANDYDRLFVIDSTDDSYVDYSTSGTEKELVASARGTNFFEDVHRDCREQVWWEDQEMFLAAFRKETVTQALKDGKSFSLTYRLNIDGAPKYFFLKTIRGNDRSIIIGVQDIDAQKRQEIEAEAASRTYSEIAGSLASLFEVIYHVDTDTGHFTVYVGASDSEDLAKGIKGEDFFERTAEDLKHVVHPDDLERVLQELDRETLLRHLEESGTVSVTYRQTYQGQTQYMNLLAFRQKNGPQRVVIGVRNIDAQMKRESESRTYSLIAGALASRYEAIYYIDAFSYEYTIYSASERYSRLGTTRHGKNFFADAASDIKKLIHPHDKQRILTELRPENLMSHLAESGSLSLVYRQLLDGRQQYVNLMVVRPKNDPGHIVMGVFNTDAQVRREKAIESQSQTFSDIAMALAQRYEVIYHVNIITNEFTEYSASEKYSKLKVGNQGQNFFATTQENMKRDIYPDDLPMMALSMQKENLLNSLSTFGKTILNYRLMMDGRPQYVSLYAVRPKEDSSHIIIAVANVDAAKRMEIAYQNAVDMANRDALTGVKNKRAYVQAETELDEMIDKQNNPPFAIVICDVNGLKQVNDTQGHKAGDDFIRSACSIICNNFKHSPVFRIGGDEFAVILKGTDYEHRTELMEQLDQVLRENPHNGVVIIAAGISDFVPEQDMRVQDVFERADDLMYDNKEVCKAGIPAER